MAPNLDDLDGPEFEFEFEFGPEFEFFERRHRCAHRAEPFWEYGAD